MKNIFGVLTVVLLFLAIGLIIWAAVGGSKPVESIAGWIAMAGIVSFFCYMRVGKPLKESLQILVAAVLGVLGVQLIRLLPRPWSGRALLLAIVALSAGAAIAAWLKKRKREGSELPTQPPESGQTQG